MKLTPAQRRAVKLLWTSKKPVLWAGSIRCGKTTGACVGYALRAQTFPGNYIVAGRTYSAVMRNVVIPLRQICEDLGIRQRLNRSTQNMNVGDSVFYIFGANSEASQDKIQGMTARGALLDEALLMPKSFVVQSIGRCSMPDSRIMMTMNKGNPNHWIKKELIDEDKVSLIENTLADNPHIAKDALDMYDAMFSGHYKARMIDNLWSAATGQIFPDPILTDRSPTNGQKVISIDPAQSGTTAALLFVHEKGVWYLVNEYYETGERSPEDHAVDIAAMAPEAHMLIDPSGANLRHALQKIGCHVSNANNDVGSGIQYAQSALRRGVIQVRHAPNLLSEIGGYVWDEKSAEHGEDRPVKQRDHACDALRYFARRYCPPKIMTPQPKPKGL